MVQLSQALKKENHSAQLLLQVHDELVLEVHHEALESIRNLVIKIMEQAVSLSVPLVVETGAGDNWMEVK